MQDKDTVARFLECCGQFERIVNDSGLLRMVRLTDEEITGTETSAGIIEKYFSLFFQRKKQMFFLKSAL